MDNKFDSQQLIIFNNQQIKQVPNSITHKLNYSFEAFSPNSARTNQESLAE